LTKGQQIKAIEERKRKEKHAVEQQKLDAIEDKIQNARKRIEDQKR
jgi:hypothetical protein